MIKVGKASYIALGQLNKLNKSVKKYNHLKNLYAILEEALYMLEKGEYSANKLHNKFPGRDYLKHSDFTKPFHVYSTIDPHIYFQLQTVLREITGKIWEMDVFLDFIIYWFIYFYKDKKIYNKRLPFYKTKQSIKEKYKLANKFEKQFKKYYKNIMGTWEKSA